MSLGIVAHENPAWREKANFLIHAEIKHEGKLATWHLEQLWTRQLDDNRFEICCVPFFIYDLVLGDEVETWGAGEQRYLFQRVVKQSGRYAFRIWFTNDVARTEVPNALTQLGCLIEQQWNSSNRFAIDADSQELARQVAALLLEREQLGHLEIKRHEQNNLSLLL